MSLPTTYKVVFATEAGEPIIKEVPLQKPSTDQVLIKVEYAPINPADLIRIQGFFGKAADYSIGAEGSGVVVAVGNDLKKPWNIGDRVHINHGTWGQYLLTNSENVSKVLQDDFSLEDAAAHWSNPATVYYMALTAERGGHKAVIHTAGSSALGRMLVRYFKHEGIKTINIVRREEYIEELKKEGADYVLNSQAADFEEKLKEMADKENATLALDAIGGDFTGKVLKAQPPGSSCLIYGSLSGASSTNISIVELFKGKTLGSFTLANYMKELIEKGELAKVRDHIHSLLPTLLTTKVQKVFKIDDLQEAIAYYKDNSSKGKILLKFH